MDARFIVIGAERCGLGESPVWDPDLGALFWIDAMAPAIWRLDLATGAQQAFPAPDVVGCVVLSRPGTLIATLRDGVRRFDLADGTFESLAVLADFEPGARLNDGKTDRLGRLVTGAMNLAGRRPPVGKLYRFGQDWRPQVLETGVGVSNAICFSPGGERLYFADSLAHTIWAYDYDQDTGAAGPRTALFDTADLGSVPDGATVDADGCIWVALPFAGRLARISPAGALERVLETPVPFPTCPAFGGPDLDRLFVTSISNSGGRVVTDHPDAGRLMVIEGLGVRGLAEARCLV